MKSRASSGINRLHSVLLAGLVLCLLSIPVLAQNSIGTILGTVKDQSGGAVPGAMVVITNTDTGLMRTVMTEADGSYRVPALPVGPYAVTVTATGFTTQDRKGLTLEVSQEAVVNFDLQVGSTTQTVTVSGETPLVDTTNSVLGGTMTELQIANLPLNGRNYADLTFMEPGIVSVLNTPGNPLRGGTGGEETVSNGATIRSNWITLDGTSVMSADGTTSASASGTTLGVDGIQEFRSVTTTYGAEYGMRSGAHTLMVSRNGTNNFHGDIYEFLRNEVLDARSTFDYGYLTGLGRLPPYKRNQFGGSFGGPIQKDKTFFYAVYEGLRADQNTTINDTVPDTNCHGPAGAVVWNGLNTRPAGSLGPCTQLGANPAGPGTNSVTINPVIAPLLALYPNPNLPGFVLSFQSANPLSASNFGQLRVDHTFSQSDTIFARYTIEKVSYSANELFPGIRTSNLGANQYSTLAETHIFSPNVGNTIGLGLTKITYNEESPGFPTAFGPAYAFTQGLGMGSVSITGGYATYGAHNTDPGQRNLMQWALKDDLFYTKGRHALKFGVLFNRFNQLPTGGAARGAVSFNNLASYMEGVYVQYTDLTPGSVIARDWLWYTYGFYAQDDWKILPRLTLNLGLRYEPTNTLREVHGDEAAMTNIATQTLPTVGLSIKNTSLTDFSPRIGIAWDPTGSGKLAVRAGFGEYYDTADYGALLRGTTTAPPPIASSSQHLNDPSKCLVPGPNCFNGSQTLVLPFGNAFSVAEAGKTINPLQDYNYGQPHNLQASLTVERQLPWSMSLSVSYLYTRGIDLVTDVEGNPETPTFLPNGMPSWTLASPRRNSYWQSITLATTAGDSWFDAMNVVLNKKLSHGFSFQSAYQWQKSIDTTQSLGGECSGSAMSVYSGNLKLAAKGPTCFEVPQNWHFNLLYYFPNVHSNRLAAKLIQGWWMGNVVAVQSGSPFTPTLGNNRSESGNFGSAADYASPNTAAGIAAAISSGQCPNPCPFIPFNKKTVYANPHPDPTATGAVDYFNPYMFNMGTVGQLGSASRNMLLGPGYRNWDFNLSKSTPLPFLGEAGKLTFRAEFFNILNFVNLGQPSTSIFTAKVADVSPYSEAPLASAGRITTVQSTPRQIQFSLKVDF